MAIVSRFLVHRSAPRALGRGDPFGPVEQQGRARRRPKLPGRRFSRRWALLLPVILMLIPPVMDVVTGLRTTDGTGCRLLRVQDGNTVLLQCADQMDEGGALRRASILPAASGTAQSEPSNGVVAVQLLGVQSPPILGARCLSEALAGLKASVMLRARLWLASDLRFTMRPGQNVALAFADGESVNRALQGPARDICD